jgi:hypothetical protein
MAGGKYNCLESVHCVAKLSAYYIVYALNLIVMKPKIVRNNIPVKDIFKSTIMTKVINAFTYF